MKSLTVLAALTIFYATNALATCNSSSKDIYIPARDLVNLSLTQDSSVGASNVTDPSGRVISPIFAWIKVWYSSNRSDTVMSIRDIKIAFPTHDDAVRYAALASHQLSEGAPEVENYKYKGSSVTLFGPRPAGINSFGNAAGIPAITAYVYVSVTDNVVSKIFVQQGLESTTALTPDTGRFFANAVIDSISRVCK